MPGCYRCPAWRGATEEGRIPIHHAVLGLLARGPSYGYQLKGDFERAVGPQWGELKVGHLYQVLERLERDGLVAGRVIRQSRRPDKTVYRLTRSGQRELDGWLDRPHVRQAGYRDDFFLKLVVAAGLGSDRLRHVFQSQREAYLSELAALTRLRREHRGMPLVELLLEAAVLHTKANLQVAELAEQRADALVSDATAAELSSQGRPATRIGKAAGT